MFFKATMKEPSSEILYHICAVYTSKWPVESSRKRVRGILKVEMAN